MDDLIEIKSVSFSKNPCETNEQITLSVEISESLNSCILTESGITILTADGHALEFASLSVNVIADENESILTDENNNILID